MDFEVKYGTNAPEGFLKEVYALDMAVYSPSLCGELKNLEKRHQVCKDSFILIYSGKELVAYLNLFPVGEKLYEELNDPDCDNLRDDDIAPEEILDWRQVDKNEERIEKKNNLFIISAVVKEDYRDGEAIKLLGNALLDFLREKEKAGYRIGSISGSAISDGGANFLKRFRAGFVKYVYENAEDREAKIGLSHEEKYRYYRTAGENLDELLGEKGLLIYKKTYQDDLYFFLPMIPKAGGNTDELIAELDKKQQKDDEISKNDGVDDFSELYREAMKDHTDYECSNEVFRKNIRRYNLGSYYLACYNDNYDDTVIEKQMVHLFLTAHIESGLYIVTIAIPENKYMTTQLVDQMSQSAFDIYLPDGTLKSVFEYVKENFDLISGGESKCVACLTNEPANRDELAYILTGETYVSSKINYRIMPERLQKLLEPKAVYDYYERYISRQAVVYVFKDMQNTTIEDRLSSEASVLFIVGIVLFQNIAVARTNRRVVDALTNSDGMTNEEISDIYVEFGKTMRFWDTNIYNYPFSQKEADEVIDSFGIKDQLEEYYRNQGFLDRMIEIRTSLSSEKSARITNLTLYILSWVQGAAGLIGVLLWFLNWIVGEEPISTVSNWIELIVGILLCVVAFLIAISAEVVARKGGTKKKKKKNKKNKR